MAGINLSQSIQENRKSLESRSFFDIGFVVSLVLFLLVAGTLIGMKWYTQTMNDKISGLEQVLQNNTARLHGNNVDRIADFDNRQFLIGKNLNDTLDMKQALEQMESLMVPNVVLTQYELNKKEHRLTIGGGTDNFKYLAQQIMSLKTQSAFSDVKVDTIERTKEGKIDFTLVIPLPVKTE